MKTKQVREHKKERPRKEKSKVKERKEKEKKKNKRTKPKALDYSVSKSAESALTQGERWTRVVNGSRDEAQKLRLSLRHLQMNDITRKCAGRKSVQSCLKGRKERKTKGEVAGFGKKRVSKGEIIPRSTRAS